MTDFIGGEVREGQGGGVAPGLDGFFGLPGEGRVVTGVAGPVVDGGGEGEAGSCVGDEFHDTEEQVFADAEVFGVVAGGDVGEEVDIEGVGCEGGKADAGGLGVDAWVGDEEFTEFGEDEAELVGGGFVAELEGGTEEHAVAFGEVFELEVCEFGVGDTDDAAFEGADTGGAEADLFDRTDFIAIAAEVTDAEGAIGVEGEAGDHILEGGLGGEGEGEATDTEAGEDAEVGDGPDLGEEEGGGDEDEDTEQAESEGGEDGFMSGGSEFQGAELGGDVGAAVGEPGEAGDGESAGEASGGAGDDFREAEVADIGEPEEAEHGEAQGPGDGGLGEFGGEGFGPGVALSDKPEEDGDGEEGLEVAGEEEGGEGDPLPGFHGSDLSEEVGGIGAELFTDDEEGGFGSVEVAGFLGHIFDSGVEGADMVEGIGGEAPDNVGVIGGEGGDGDIADGVSEVDVGFGLLGVIGDFLVEDEADAVDDMFEVIGHENGFFLFDLDGEGGEVERFDGIGFTADIVLGHGFDDGAHGIARVLEQEVLLWGGGVSVAGEFQ